MVMRPLHDVADSELRHKFCQAFPDRYGLPPYSRRGNGYHYVKFDAEIYLWKTQINLSVSSLEHNMIPGGRKILTYIKSKGIPLWRNGNEYKVGEEHADKVISIIRKATREAKNIS